MTTYNKTEIAGHIYEMKTNAGAIPRCWKDGEQISYEQYMEEVYDHLADKYGKKSYGKDNL